MSSPTLKQIRPLAFILNVQMTIRTSDAEAFLAAIKPAYDAVLKEPECAFFNLGQRHPLNPLTGEPSTGEGETVISFSEGWNCTLEWFREVQLKKEYYGPYQAATQPMYTKPRKFLLAFFCAIVPCVLQLELTENDCGLAAFEIVIPSEEFCHYKESM